MARAIKEGQSIYIPFVDGESVFDSQNKPRMYKSVEQFERSYPRFRLKEPKLVEYAPVVHGKWENNHWRNSISCSNCSNCNFEAQHGDYRGVNEKYKYCPNCGAKMDLED